MKPLKLTKSICLLFGCFIAITCAAKVQTDADISKALVGTWTDAPSKDEPMHTKVSYYADGKGVQLVWQKGQSASTAVRVETAWSVTNGILVLRSVKSNDTQKIPRELS